MLCKRIRILPLAALCLLASCAGKQVPSGNKTAGGIDIRHAAGFTVTPAEGYTVVDVIDPWRAAALLRRYILVDRDSALPHDLPRGLIIRTPIRRLAVYDAIHAAMIDELGETERIVGLCEPHYISIPSIRQRVADGTIADLGPASAPNIEKMLDINVEHIVATPFQNADYGAAAKTGIPIIEGADYMESLPLGRAEWLRFFGILLGKEAMADSIFAQTEARYLALKDLVAPIEYRPTVFSEKKYGASWYVPGGQSYIAALFRDAGASYIFEDIAGSGSVPLSFETVLDRAVHADFWLIKYNEGRDMTLGDLSAEYPAYNAFDAFRNGSVYGCNTGRTPYYEDSALHPDAILRDFISIFHPDALRGRALRYYGRMDR